MKTNIPANEIPDCPKCDTAMKPERIGAGRYVCGVCSRVFTIPKSSSGG